MLNFSLRDFAEFVDFDDGAGHIEEIDAAETYPPFENQISEVLKDTTGTSEDFRRREIELELEETALQLRRNKLKQELLMLRNQQTAPLESTVPIPSVPDFEVLERAPGPSASTTRWPDDCQLSNHADTGFSDFNSAIDWKLDGLMFSETDTNMLTTRPADRNEHALAPWSESANTNALSSGTPISVLNSCEFPPTTSSQIPTLPTSLPWKRKRGANDEGARQMSILRQKLAKSAVPGTFINFICQQPDSVVINAHTSTQKKNKKAVRSCLLCKILRVRVSG